MTLATLKDGRAVEMRSATIGIQKTVLKRFKEETEEYRGLELMQRMIRVETAPDSGTFRAIKESEFDAMTDRELKPITQQFRRSQPKAEALKAMLEDVLVVWDGIPEEARVAIVEKLEDMPDEPDPLA
jgi:hypothetical protein